MTYIYLYLPKYECHVIDISSESETIIGPSRKHFIHVCTRLRRRSSSKLCNNWRSILHITHSRLLRLSWRSHLYISLRIHLCIILRSHLHIIQGLYLSMMGHLFLSHHLNVIITLNIYLCSVGFINSISGPSISSNSSKSDTTVCTKLFSHLYPMRTGTGYSPCCTSITLTKSNRPI